MPFLLAEILNFQGSTHQYGVGSFSNLLYEKYRQLAESENNVIFGGRLGNYKYYDMDKVIEAALDKIEELK